MKYLINLYACEPHKGSEPGVGWNHLQQISKKNKVHVIVESRHKKAIITEMKRNGKKNIIFHFIDIRGFLKYIKYGFGRQLYYYLWYVKAARYAKKLDKIENFDLVHHLTFGCDWLPARLYNIDKPFLWGPVGGSNISVPINFWYFIGFKGLCAEAFRNFFQWFFMSFDFGLWKTRKRATKILVSNRNSYDMIPTKYKEKTSIMTRMGCSEVKKYLYRNNIKLKIVYGGLLLHWKGVKLALYSFHELQKIIPHAELLFIGKGPEKENLQKITKQLKITDKVEFIDFLPQKEYFSTMKSADIFLFPSFHDSGGLVCIEAMAHGIPVVCLDCGGPGYNVPDSAGIKVKPINPKQTIEDLSDALIKLAKDKKLREKMGKAGIQTVKEKFLWKHKEKQYKKYYQEAIDNFTNKNV